MVVIATVIVTTVITRVIRHEAVEQFSGSENLSAVRYHETKTGTGGKPVDLTLLEQAVLAKTKGLLESSYLSRLTEQLICGRSFTS